jgi:methyl-accepting chemotaxis protein
VSRFARPLERLAEHARELADCDPTAVAEGESTADVFAADRDDEVGQLAQAFRHMVSSLRTTIATERRNRGRIEALLGSIREAVPRLSSSSAEILAGTTAQAAGAREQAASVSQTVTIVDQVAQVAGRAAQRAQSVGETSRRALAIGDAGRAAVESPGRPPNRSARWPSGRRPSARSSPRSTTLPSRPTSWP